MAPPEALSPAPASLEEVQTLLERPLLELVYEAAQVHRAHHDPGDMQCSQLLSIKTVAVERNGDVTSLK